MNNIELDQKLETAFCMSAGDIPYRIKESEVFHSLNKQNVVSTRFLNLDALLANLGDRTPTGSTIVHNRLAPKDEIRSGDTITTSVLNRALEIRREPHTLGSKDFLRAIIEVSFETDDIWGLRPRTADILALLFAGDEQMPLAEVPEARRLMQQLLRATHSAEDYQYILAVEENRLVFRVTSTLDDFVQVSDSGLLVPQRAILLHHQQQFGSIFPNEIEELEDLLNSGKAKELDFQRFFDTHPHFFRVWDHREIHSQVYLAREDAGPLVPDFILTDRELQKATIVDLKLPGAKLVRRQHNRDRFTAAINEARAQLLAYRDWFEQPHNRERLRAQTGMRIYRPRLAVVIGRSTEVHDEIDRQRLVSQAHDIEVVTYDDIVASAKRRLLLLGGSP